MRIALPRSKFLRFLLNGGVTLGLSILAGFVVLSHLLGTKSKPSDFSEIVGVPLPASASDPLVCIRAGLFGGDYYASATMPHEDFAQIVGRLGLWRRSDLLEYWSSALNASNCPWWTVTSTNDADTYFGDAEASTYLVARYEGGRIYLKRHVY